MLSLRRPDGSDYEPYSLTSHHRAIDRFLRENRYGFSIVSSLEFEMSKKVLEAKRKELKGKGKGNRPNKSKALSENEIEKLW